MAHKHQRKDISRLTARVASFLKKDEGGRRPEHEGHPHHMPSPPHHTNHENHEHHPAPEHHQNPQEHHTSHHEHHTEHKPEVHHEHHQHNQHHEMKKQHKTHHLKEKRLPPQPRILELDDQREIAQSFAASVHKKFDSIVKATILFGSQAKKTATPTSDIDLVVLIDDVSINWDQELIAWYREELGKLVAQNKYAHELHVNTIKLSTWWQDLLNGDPVVLNIIRYGEPLIDIAGFFKPLKVLLFEGKIHSTPEAVYTALQRAPQHLARSRIAQLSAIEGIYWTMVDSAQAALITAGQLPPSPEHITSLLKEQFVDRGLMKMDYVYWYRDCFTLHKAVIHGAVQSIKGQDIDSWQQRAEQFMKKMTDIIDHILSTRK